MAIQDDFVINPETKVIRHDATKSTIYSAVAFYSYLQDVFDEPGFLSYEIPIRFNTPTSFTMLNGWFLDDGDGSNLLQFLTGGGIDTLNYATISDPVLMLDLDNQTSAFVAADLDQVLKADDAEVGPLLSYKENYPSAGLARVWLRDTNSHGQIVPAQVIESYPGTTGDYLAADYSASGDNIYHNLFTIAAFPGSPNPQLYVYQDHPVDASRTRIAEWSAFTNFDRGTIDILITTQLAGTLIDGGNITTFVRQTADSFTFVESTLTTSGRTPIATETSADEVNITTGEHYMFYDNSTGDPDAAFNGPTDYGFIISDVPIGIIDTDITPPTWYAEVVGHTYWGADTANTGYLILRGLRGIPVDNDTIYAGDPDAADPVDISQSGNLVGTQVNGTVGDTLVSYDASSIAPDAGDLDLPIEGSLSGAHRIMRAFQDDTGSGKLCLQVLHAHDIAFDSQDYTGTAAQHTPGRIVLYTAFLDNDVVDAPASGTSGMGITLDAASTTLISGYSDVTVGHLSGEVTVSALGSFTAGERVTWNAGGSEGIYVTDNGSTTMMLANVDPTDEPDASDTFTGDISAATAACDSGLTDDNTENFEFSLQTTGALYSVFVEGGSIYDATEGRTLTDIYAYLQFYLRDGQNTTQRTIYTSDGATITALAAEEYIKADPLYGSTKAAPYGTLAGGVFFGATAVWLQGMADADANNVKLTDTNAGKNTFTLREPFTAITVRVTNTRADDRIAIFLEDGTTELPSKTQYTSAATATNALGDETFERNTGAFPNDTPLSGAFIVVDSTLKKQHRYRYASRNGTTDPGILTVPTERIGTSEAPTAGQILADDEATFTTWAVLVGDIIHRTSGTFGFAYVTSVDSETQVTTTLIEDTNGTAATSWTAGDQFAIYSLVKTYDTIDTFFVPYMDEIETVGDDITPGSITVNLTYVADREIILEVRNVEAATEIIPFKTTGQILIGGYSQGVIRNEDTVTT